MCSFKFTLKKQFVRWRFRLVGRAGHQPKASIYKFDFSEVFLLFTFSKLFERFIHNM